MNTFEMVDEALSCKGYHDNRDAAMYILETGIREGTLADVAKTVAGRYDMQPAAVIEWFSEVLKCRAQHAIELLQKMAEMAKAGE